MINPATIEMVMWVMNCPGVAAGKDSRGYWFQPIRVHGQWRITAGCRNFSVEDARRHWGPDGVSDRSDCLALVEKCVEIIEKSELGMSEANGL